eukprot:TRINITY_DN36374_c0_g1_i1.p1 TRINITY_DN36374_c0_g1~~TRINITY_DN36374_c0_g1_i1.p1  ORF type:complete len:699 (+),score=160.15 TRINITY_DN36374_c0_g1_i1:45-2099(+)
MAALDVVDTAIAGEPALDDGLDRWTDHGYKRVQTVGGLVLCGQDTAEPFIFVATDGPSETPFYVASVTGAGALVPCHAVAQPGGTIVRGEVVQVSEGHGLVVQGFGDLWMVVPPRPGSGDVLYCQVEHVLACPKGAEELEVAVKGRAVVRAVALTRAVARKAPKWTVLGVAGPDSTLSCWSPGEDGGSGKRKFTTAATVPCRAEGLIISANGERVAWRVRYTEVVEEAQRADWWSLDLTDAAAQPVQVTRGAQKTEDAVLSACGTKLYFFANYAERRPITSHVHLFVAPAGGGDASLVTSAVSCPESMGWIDAAALWVTFTDGCDTKTCRVAVDGGVVSPMTDQISACAAFSSAGHVFATESRTELPHVAYRRGDDVKRFAIPSQPTDLRFVSEVVSWRAPDAKPVSGLLYTWAGMPKSNVVLAAVHGGPMAATSGNLRHVSSGAGLRSFVAAGYAVLVPMYRGSAGFGDQWAQDMIGRPGHKDTDLGDVLSGVDWLRSSGRVDSCARAAIVGGSYGGFMTLRALSEAPEFFSAGVARYGFISHRWMDMETGDLSWEHEYLDLPRGQPPPWPSDTASDVFPNVHRIQAPLLLLHGDADPCCPISHSKIVYRVLKSQGKRCGMVVYHAEGHGWVAPEVRRDSVRRHVAWLLEHVPTKPECRLHAASAQEGQPRKKARVMVLSDSD